MIGRKEVREAFEAWLHLPHRRPSSLPVEAVRLWPLQAPPSSGRRRPEPWAAAQRELDRKLAEFEALEKRMAQAAQRDGLDGDGPMVPTLQALHLCIDSLREMTRVASEIPSHYVGEILDALSVSRTVTQAETDRFRAEIENTELDIVHRIANSIAQSADKALARRVRVFDRNTALAAVVILLVTAFGCFRYGYRMGASDAGAQIQQTEWRLQAAFANGGVGASIWALLMEANDITAAIKECHGANMIRTGAARTACLVPLWTSSEPESPPPRERSNPETGFLEVAPVSPAAAPAATAPEDTGMIPLFTLPQPPTRPVHFGPQASR